MLIEVQCRVSGPVTRMPATVAKAACASFTLACQARPRPRQENRATKRGRVETRLRSQLSSWTRDTLQEMQELRVPEEQWELRGRRQFKAETHRCTCVKMLWKARGSSPPAGPQHGSWRCVRVGARNTLGRDCGGSPSKGQDPSLWPGNAFVCPVLSLLRSDLRSKEGLLHFRRKLLHQPGTLRALQRTEKCCPRTVAGRI